jgi:hypothetical protein
LKTQNVLLVEKNKHLVDQVEKRKREITTLKRDVQRLKSNGKTKDPPPIPDIEIRPAPTNLSGTKRQAVEDVLPPAPDANLMEVARKYKERSVWLS